MIRKIVNIILLIISFFLFISTVGRWYMNELNRGLPILNLESKYIRFGEFFVYILSAAFMFSCLKFFTKKNKISEDAQIYISKQNKVYDSNIFKFYKIEFELTYKKEIFNETYIEFELLGFKLNDFKNAYFRYYPLENRNEYGKEIYGIEIFHLFNLIINVGIFFLIFISGFALKWIIICAANYTITA
jgi:hypothetical protein